MRVLNVKSCVSQPVLSIVEKGWMEIFFAAHPSFSQGMHGRMTKMNCVSKTVLSQEVDWDQQPHLPLVATVDHSQTKNGICVTKL